ncbi:hypothetical protein COT97_04270 [Candidatus Falkowbacteria bacterium CG10_big_fil_rev_8_21_14_0_10_39_11]|uniref:Uncharacterized protein n=1 Tax=Candidatus Falkowbacteria bacterium CG10_big_fil_rev_8_21_14_0_10_39_11 TaxID=1974565 RepID=A0A2H0V4B5_9BACT|nr:MAG: hypothetical protein COT97_04270 [Candidatus Falkowbacteria bacterium CG10_big_fil_rev_8_21_14_0_10_39_11]
MINEPKPNKPTIDKAKPEQSEIKTLDMKQIVAMLDEAGVSKNNYEKEWNFEADIYREIIWRLANIFSKRQGWGTETTHSEYAADKKTGLVNSLHLCLEFFEDTEDAERRDYEEFKTFLEQNILLIPQELRQRFKMYVGFNYGNNGAVVIDDNKIKIIDQDDFMKLPSDGAIGYPNRTTRDKLIDTLADKLESIIEK